MKNILRLFRRFDKDYKNFTLYICLMSIIMGFLPLINIYAPKLIIEELIGRANQATIAKILGLVLLVNIILVLLRRVYEAYFTLVFESMTDKLLFELSEKSLTLPIEKTDSKDVQDMLEKAHVSVFNIYDLWETLNIATSSLITGVFALAILVKLNLFLPLLGVGIIIANRIFVKLIKKNEIYYQEKSAGENRIYRYFSEFAQDNKHAKDIKIYGGEELILSKSEKYLNKLVNTNKQYYTKNGFYGGMMNITSSVGIVLALTYLTYRLTNKSVSLADFTLYFSSIIQLINTVNIVQKNYAQVISVNENMNSYFEFMNLPERSSEEGEISTNKLDKVSIKFDKVSFKYPKSNSYILKNCSFEIKDGETVALVGKNGAGKSTIVKLLCKFYDPSEGNIYINDINIKDISAKDYHKILSPTFQDFRLFPFKISENIAGIKEEEISKDNLAKIKDSTKLLGIDEWIASTSKGLATYLTLLFSKEGVEPSGGLGQKIALARSMAHGGGFFIMDEPTSALDPRSEQEIFEKMLEISKGQTSLFISHRLSSTKYADRIIVCDDGKIIENGNHDSLIKKDGLYKKMYTSQADLYI
ncbi:ABC transporter ATP-binding protein [uncultured Anaerococcus sp.]|uniref:ABC transporter ATP-binding protein n=1 Tax=uncultured Anaerococcus sp. TaxID=293428 RepID=UPI00288AB091|nr:ABC transporter ATP-binding protein [uncultured Anaerococcus sp.]